MTTEELIKEKDYWFFETLPGNQDTFILKEDISELMIKFAQFHVKLALSAAYENIEYTEENSSVPYVKEDSILNAYPLSNIK